MQKRLAVTSISSRTGSCLYRLARQICHHSEVDAKFCYVNERCGRDVGHQMANFCYTGVAVQNRLAVTSISSRTGCCLYRLPHQCSAWGGKSVITQRSTQKPVQRVKNMNKTSIMIDLIEQERTAKPTMKTLLRLPRSHSNDVAER